MIIIDITDVIIIDVINFIGGILVKSIKRGRGPSGMSALVGIFVALFGVFWTVLALSMGAWFMVPFGVIFIIIAVVNVVYNAKNATGENRYSEFDIVDSEEEADPLDKKYGAKSRERESEKKNETPKFCPYCGAPAK